MKTDRNVLSMIAGALILLSVPVVAAVTNVSCKGAVVYYTITSLSDVSITISSEDTHVRTLFCRKQSPGFYAATWDGLDDEGHAVRPANYIVRIDSGMRAVLENTFARNGVLRLGPSVRNIETDATGSIYVHETGRIPGDKSGARPRGYIYKYRADGKPAMDFSSADNCKPSNALEVGSAVSSIKVASDGTIFLATMGYHVITIDCSGNAQYRIGQTDAGKPGYVVNPADLALGAARKLYIYLQGRWVTRVYDSRKEGGAGFLYSSRIRLSAGY